MKTILTASVVTGILALGLALTGCNTEREKDLGDRALLKAGQQVSEDMVGWVAVPNTAPKLEQNKTAGITYGVLAAHNVVPAGMDNWYAVNPALFAKMTDIKIEAPKVATVEKWVLKPVGKKVPADKDGWAAVPNTQPTMDNREAGYEIGTLFTNNVVPKEMNGWAAIDKETMAKLSEKYSQTGSGARVDKLPKPK